MSTKYIVNVKSRLKENGKWVCRGTVFKDSKDRVVEQLLDEYETEFDSQEAAERWGKLNTVQWLKRRGIGKEDILVKN